MAHSSFLKKAEREGERETTSQDAFSLSLSLSLSLSRLLRIICPGLADASYFLFPGLFFAGGETEFFVRHTHAAIKKEGARDTHLSYIPRRQTAKNRAQRLKSGLPRKHCLSIRMNPLNTISISSPHTATKLALCPSLILFFGPHKAATPHKSIFHFRQKISIPLLLLLLLSFLSQSAIFALCLSPHLFPRFIGLQLSQHLPASHFPSPSSSWRGQEPI